MSCPAAAPASCKLSLKLAARLPGRKKSATIATASKTAKPGAGAKITLKLSSSARSALAKKKKLSAVLTLAGAAPVTVQLNASKRRGGRGGCRPPSGVRRLAEVEALPEVHAELGHGAELVHALDALGDDLGAEFVGAVDERLDEAQAGGE